mmetsp:Transcript_51014/g.133541  ORF Transcript_51014/g.133541 Transcript_51014/m.133541 type:complete len:161 (-) Transcript_51014:307-789(-)
MLCLSFGAGREESSSVNQVLDKQGRHPHLVARQEAGASNLQVECLGSSSNSAPSRQLKCYLIIGLFYCFLAERGSSSPFLIFLLLTFVILSVTIFWVRGLMQVRVCKQGAIGIIVRHNSAAQECASLERKCQTPTTYMDEHSPSMMLLEGTSMSADSKPV